MSDMKCWRAVRCCCDPKRIIGFIRAPVDASEFSVTDRNGHRHDLRVAPLTETRRRGAATVSHGREVAVHSDHRSLEFWRTIDGFVEAVHPGTDADTRRDT